MQELADGQPFTILPDQANRQMALVVTPTGERRGFDPKRIRENLSGPGGRTGRCDESPRGGGGSIAQSGSKVKEVGGPGASWDGDGRKKGFMFDPEEMKEEVRKYLVKQQYDVRDFYKETGICQMLATNYLFENLTLLVITFNALWMAFDTNNNLSNYDPNLPTDTVFQAMDNFFCSYFVFELLIRFGAFKRKRNCVRDYWFIFDSVLVVHMVWDVWVYNILQVLVGNFSSVGSWASIARLLRLLRLMRLARMLRAFPELMILIKGMIAASYTTTFCIALLVLIMYVFAIVLKSVANDYLNTVSGNYYFPDVGTAMVYITVTGLFFDSLTQTLNTISEPGVTVNPDGSTQANGTPFAGFVMMLFMLIGAYTMLNLLLGVLFEVANGVAEMEKEEMTVSFVMSKMGKLVEQIDINNDGLISQSEFMQIMIKPEACRLLQEVGVDPVGLLDFADFIFDEGDSREHDPEDEGKRLSLEEFTEVLLQFRGSNMATIKDMVDLRKFFKQSVRRIIDRAEGRRGTKKDEALAATQDLDDENLPRVPPCLSCLRSNGNDPTLGVEGGPGQSSRSAGVLLQEDVFDASNRLEANLTSLLTEVQGLMVTLRASSAPPAHMAIESYQSEKDGKRGNKNSQRMSGKLEDIRQAVTVEAVWSHLGQLKRLYTAVMSEIAKIRHLIPTVLPALTGKLAEVEEGGGRIQTWELQVVLCSLEAFMFGPLLLSLKKLNSCLPAKRGSELVRSRSMPQLQVFQDEPKRAEANGDDEGQLNSGDDEDVLNQPQKSPSRKAALDIRHSDLPQLPQVVLDQLEANIKQLQKLRMRWRVY